MSINYDDNCHTMIEDLKEKKIDRNFYLWRLSLRLFYCARLQLFQKYLSLVIKLNLIAIIEKPWWLLKKLDNNIRL